MESQIQVEQTKRANISNLFYHIKIPASTSDKNYVIMRTLNKPIINKEIRSHS